MSEEPKKNQRPKTDPETLEAIESFSNNDGTTKDPQQWQAEQNQRIQEVQEKTEKKGIWDNLTGAEKYMARIHIAAVAVPAIVAIVTILLTIENANKQIKLAEKSVAAVLKQDTTNQENLELMQREFELNYRPYMSIASTNVIIKNNQAVIELYVKNLGTIPGDCKIMYITRFKDQPNQGPVRKEIIPNVFFPNQESKLEIKYEKEEFMQMAFFNINLDYKTRSGKEYKYSTFYNFEINIDDSNLILKRTLTN